MGPRQLAYEWPVTVCPEALEHQEQVSGGLGLIAISDSVR